MATSLLIFFIEDEVDDSSNAPESKETVFTVIYDGPTNTREEHPVEEGD